MFTLNKIWSMESWMSLKASRARRLDPTRSMSASRSFCNSSFTPSNFTITFATNLKLLARTIPPLNSITKKENRIQPFWWRFDKNHRRFRYKNEGWDEKLKKEGADWGKIGIWLVYHWKGDSYKSWKISTPCAVVMTESINYYRHKWLLLWGLGFLSILKRRREVVGRD